MSEIDKQLKENIGMFYVHAVVENDVRVKIIAIRRLLGSLLTAAKQKNDILNIKTIASNINKLERARAILGEGDYNAGEASMYCEQVMDFCMELVYGGYSIISDENNLTLSSMRPTGETNE